MKYLLTILILYSVSLKAQDTLVLKTKYSAIVLGDKIFKVKVSLEEAPAAIATASKSVLPVKIPVMPKSPLMSARPVGNYVNKSDFDTKMSDIDSKINKANSLITSLQSKDTTKLNKTDFNTKVKDILNKIGSSDSVITALQNKKVDTMKLSGNDFIMSGGTVSIKR